MRLANNKLSKDVSIEETVQLMNRNNSKMNLAVDHDDVLHGVIYRHKQGYWNNYYLRFSKTI